MEFHNLPYIYLIKICIMLNSGAPQVTNNINEYIILIISILGGGLVSLFTTLLIYWFQERQKNKYNFLDDLFYVKETLQQKKDNQQSNIFSITKIKPFSKKKLIDEKLYTEIDSILKNQSSENNILVKIDEIIKNIDKLIEKI